MVKNDLRRIVLLKNMPSNIVEEAIVVLKANKLSEKKNKKIECFEMKNKFTKNEKEEDFIIKEAQNVILEYVKTLENTKKDKNTINLEKKYRRLMYVTIVISFLYLVDIFTKLV